jgi:putative MATE family efflux protein
VRDLTRGPVAGHIFQLSTFIALTTTVQTLYFLADLYFVGRLGKEEVAGVALAGNLMMIVLALTQALGVGTTSLVSQAMGRRDRERAELVFNQSLVLSALVGLTFGAVAFVLRHAYSTGLAADAATAVQGVAYLDWFIPALALQFGLVSMGAALRGLGDMKIPTVIQVGSVVLNIALAPILMFGWVAGIALGVAGAAIASCLAVGAAGVAFAAYFRRPASPLRFRADQWRPRPRLWWEMSRIGLPAGGEFALMFVYLMVVYSIMRPFGAAAQAGFGIGMRVMQALFLPAVAIAFATAPVVGQNFGAGLGSRVREAFRASTLMCAVVMLLLSAICQVAPDRLIRVFNGDPAVVAFGSDYLRIISWTFVASGIVFTSSSVFQGIGHTLPALATSALRITLFSLPAYWLSHRPGFHMRQIWYLALGCVLLQMAMNLWVLQRELGRKLRAHVGGPAQPALSS